MLWLCKYGIIWKVTYSSSKPSCEGYHSRKEEMKILAIVIASACMAEVLSCLLAKTREEKRLKAGTLVLAIVCWVYVIFA